MCTSFNRVQNEVYLYTFLIFTSNIQCLGGNAYPSPKATTRYNLFI